MSIERQTIEVTYGINHGQASRQLGEVQKAQDRLSTSAAAMSRSVASVGAVGPATATAISSMTRSTNAAAEGLANVNQGMKDMAGRLRPAAAAISSISGALGAAGGSAGKFVGMAGQVAAAWGAGGIVGAALVAGVVALDAYESHLKNVEVAREAAFERGFDKQYGNLLKISKRTQEYNDILRELNVELRYAGTANKENLLRSEEMIRLRSEASRLANKAESPMAVGSWADRERWRSEARALEVQANKLQAIVVESLEVKRVVEEGEDAERRRLAAIEAQRRAIEGQKTAYEAMYKYREEMDQRLQDFETNTDEISRTMRGRRAVEGGGLGSAMEESARRGMELEQKANDWLDKMREEAVAHRLENVRAAGEKEIEEKKRTAAALLDIEKRNAEAILEVNRTFQERGTELLQGTVSTALSVGQAYLDAKIRGEEHAERKATAAFLTSTGQQLVASGTRAVFEGAIISSNPATPGAGALMIGAGVAAIGVGVGMGAAGSAVSASIPAPRDAPMKDINGPPRRGGGLNGPGRNGDGGGITIIYQGAIGATREDTARGVGDAQARLRRRGGRNA